MLVFAIRDPTIPIFQKVRENARKTSCLSNLKQIGLAVTEYTQDYDENYPTGHADVLGGVWAGTIYTYVKSTDVFHCPDDPTSKSTSNGVATYPVSYAGILNFMRTDPGGGNDPHSGQALASLQSPSKTVMLCEVKGIQAAITDPMENTENVTVPIVVSIVTNGADTGSVYGYSYSLTRWQSDDRLPGRKRLLGRCGDSRRRGIRGTVGSAYRWLELYDDGLPCQVVPGAWSRSHRTATKTGFRRSRTVWRSVESRHVCRDRKQPVRRDVQHPVIEL